MTEAAALVKSVPMGIADRWLWRIVNMESHPLLAEWAGG